MKTLYECYAKPSEKKQRIYRACVNKAYADNAIRYGIKSYNTCIFTFQYTKPDGEIVIIKPSNFWSLCREYY